MASFFCPRERPDGSSFLARVQVKTCAVLTPRLGQSLDPLMARVQEPQIRT
jgi:hypothetical protein